MNGSPAAGGIAVEVVARNLLAVRMDSEADILCANWSVQLFVSPQIIKLTTWRWGTITPAILLIVCHSVRQCS